ncbi:PREDICTED: uncharacterized protein LOC106121083 [Papilio xuthus]|uniref:Uncharacterized protein LOC106121083 n=1 Tax=Papilio xuthus TaxID=66420 RepID=A0AAJ6ZG98_PAPXU|nr:PREDICTED: uncharacterized protein LOC106121083 [Papilio xuthus]
MYDFCCSNLLICYDPKYLEQRSDSSKIDRKSDMYISKWKKREFLVTDKHHKEAATHKNWKFSKEDSLNCKIKMNKPMNGLSSVTSKTQTYIPDTSVEKLLNCFNYEIDPRAEFHNISNAHKGSSTVVQKSSNFLKRSQIFPCFSNILQNHKKCCRTNVKNLSVETYREPYCARCEKRRIKCISKKRYKCAMRSPYYVDEDVKRPDSSRSERHRHSVYYNPKLIKNPFSRSSASSHTSCDSEYENISRYCYKKRMQNYILKERERNKKMNRKYFGNKKQQCYSKVERFLPYQVIATPFWEEEKSYDSNSTRCSALPSTSSGFWEYLTDKITRKTKDGDRTKSCKCGQSASFISSVNGDPDCLKVAEKMSETEKKVNAILTSPGENTEESTKDTRSKNCTCDCKKNKTETVIPTTKDVHTCSRINTPCNKCNNDKSKNDKRSKDPDDAKSNKGDEPCRAPHDEVVSKLKQKYNGEILCIHNPPCILINGCLNLPSANANQKPPVAVWPVNQMKKNSSYNFCKRIWTQKDKADEQYEIYGVPYVSSSECQIPLTKKERNNHFNQKPICELVKLSCKPKYGVTAVNPRVHVAMLRKQPKCLDPADKKQKSKYSQAANSPKKIILHRAKKKVTGFLQSKTEVLYPVEHDEKKPGTVPVYHKNRLLRMIQVKRSATK